MWDNYKLPTIINYCRRIWTINNPYRYASSIKYKTIYRKARKERSIYLKSSIYKYKAFIYSRSMQSSCYKHPLGLYCRSPIYNSIIDKCCTAQDVDEVGF